MSFAVLRCLHVCLLAGSLVVLSTAAALAADGPANTAAGASGARPVLIGNNANASGSVYSPGAGPDVQPVALSAGSAAQAGNPNAFKDLMDKANASMSANANAIAAERQKKLMAEAMARQAAYDKAMAGGGGQGYSGYAQGDGTASAPAPQPVMRYTEPNDTGRRPSHTFHIE